MPAFCDATGLSAGPGRQINRAAVLLYVNTEALRSLRMGASTCRRGAQPGGEPRSPMRRDDADVPLVLLLDRLMTITGALARSLSIRVGATQIELVDYPANALREIRTPSPTGTGKPTAS